MCGRKLRAMRRFARFLVAFLFAVAVLPAGARAMPMRMGPMAAGVAGAAMLQDCQNCPHAPSPGTASGKMLPCLTVACAGTVAMLPMPVLLPVRIALGTSFTPAPQVPLTEASRAPDPLPPRPIALI